MSIVSVSSDAAAADTDRVIGELRAYLQAQTYPQGIDPVAQDETKSIIKKSKSKMRSQFYALAFGVATFIGMGLVWHGNQVYGPEMYAATGMVPAAEASAKNLNYAVFDLNINIRALREEQIKRMTKTPDVVLLGASHWQEAHSGLVEGQEMFNAHIHRDYWEDPLGMVELFVKYDRLPKKMIISLRDNQFTPVDQRKDFLWEPGIPAYRDMSVRLGIEPQSFISTFPYDRTRALFSLPMLFENLTRWYNASERPGASTTKQFVGLDTLLPDGSIVWSEKHIKLFSQERAEKESIAFADKRSNDPPKIEPAGVMAFEKLLTFLKDKGVSVYLINPPFNPIYYDRLQGKPYAAGLEKIETLIAKIAADHNLPLIGSFNPHQVGCEASMYIDAEHANEKCLKKLFDQFTALDRAKAGL